jgi:hypothetical protein
MRRMTRVGTDSTAVPHCAVPPWRPQDMERMELEPDVLVLTEVMNMLAKSQNPGAVLRLMDKLKAAKPPDMRVHVGAMIRADELVEGEVFAELLQEVNGAIVAAHSRG